MQTRIEHLRKMRNISQRTLASSIGVSQSAISKIEKEETEPSLLTLLKIADYFHVSVDYLIYHAPAAQVFIEQSVRRPIRREELLLIESTSNLSTEGLRKILYAIRKHKFN